MAAAFRVGGTINDGQTATSTSGTFTIPGTAQVGDVALVHYIASGAAGDSWTTAPSGWTLLSGPDSSGAGAVTLGWLYAKTLVSGDPGASVTATYSTARRITGTITVLSGVALTGATSALLAVSTATTTDTLPSLASVASGSAVLGIFGRRGANTAALSSITVPANYTAGPESRSAYTTAGNNDSRVGYLITSSSGTVGGESTTSVDSTTGVDYVVAFPASSSGTAATAAGTVTVGGSAGAAAAGTAGGTVTLGGSATVTPPPGATGAVTLGGAATGQAAATASGGVGLDGAATGVAVITPLPPLVSSNARWTWSIGPWSGLPTGELPHALSRSLKLRLTGTSEAHFTLDGTVPESFQIQELVTDLWAIRNGFSLFRGRVGPTDESDDGNTSSVIYSAGDYRSVLQRRLLFDADTLTYTSVDAAAVAAGLVNTTQGHSGGNLNISTSPVNLGVTRTITYPAGQSVGEAIEALSLMDSAFNWDVIPTTGQIGQTLTVWPSRGESSQTVVNFPGRVKSYRRAVDPGTYANAVRETGNTGLAAVRVEGPNISTAPEGRWDAQMGDTSLLDTASVSARAAYDLASRQQVVPAYTVVLQPGTWGGPPDIWLGDAVLLSIDTATRQTQDTLRVFEIDIDLDDAGNETVTLILSALDPFKRSRARQYDFRLTKLERR